MRKLVPALILAGMAACMPPAYVQPKPGEPHAIVKIRATIHHRYRSNLSQELFLDEWSLDSRVYGATQGAGADTVHIRVRPEPSWFTARTVFSHTNSRTVTRPHTVTESVPCGTSPTGTPQTCTRSRTEHRTETEYYTVVDASCEDRTFLKPKPGAVYLVQYDFYGNADCRMACFEQLPTPDGRFQLVGRPR